MSESNAALSEFLTECQELSDRFSTNLTLIEQNKSTKDTIDALYRDIHTIKGCSQLFGFKQIGEVAHVMETSLDPFRRHKKNVSEGVINALSKCLDLIEEILTHVKRTQTEPDFKEAIEKIIPALVEATTETFSSEESLFRDTLGAKESLLQLQDSPQSESANQEELKSQPEANSSGDDSNTHENPIERAISTSQSSLPSEENPDNPGSNSEVNTSIRVNVGVLDNLMNFAGEMVLIRNQVLQYSQKHKDYEFLQLSQRLDGVTSELQNEVMKTRMQPIGSVLTKFQRVVRKLSKDLGKDIELQLIGAETELDKTLLEAIKDPLTHIIRNSCDHGIENPEQRAGKKKPKTGHIKVRSFHEGGQVVIEISDDGKGLDPQAIIKKAIEKNIITQLQSENLSDKDAIRLILQPGFSTAEKVTNVSGRGVGMDVVKTNLEKIGGSIELESEFGKGSLQRLKIPLTLAVVPALLIRSKNENFAIPQVKLVELVRVTKEDEKSKLEYLQGKPVLRLRENLVPIVDINEVIENISGEPERTSAQRNATRSLYNEGVNIIILDAEGRHFGLIVDDIRDTADIVVKPLCGFLKKLKIYSGATILGDGAVALILDVNGLKEKAQLFSESSQASDNLYQFDDKKSLYNEDIQDYVLLSLKSKGSFAVPLCTVNRLEEFDNSEIETSGKQRVVRYRDSILPLFSADKYLKLPVEVSAREKDVVSVIVVNKGSKSYGIEVENILDIITSDRAVDESFRDRKGILGNLIHNEEVVVVIDSLTMVEDICEQLSPGNTKNSQSLSKSKDNSKYRILVAEDSTFFRKQISLTLEKAGFNFEIHPDGQYAYEKLKSSERQDFDLVLSDIEMPRMTGLDLAAAIRANETWKDIPVVAVTTRYSERAVKEGLDAGFDFYLEKLNSEELLEHMDMLLSKKLKKGA